jgi:predicted RNase H-like HicB family nuclease
MHADNRYRIPEISGQAGIRREREKYEKNLTAIIEREEDGYVALCPELDIASQGESIEEAHINLTETLELFLEAADPSEIQSRMLEEIFVTRLEEAVG